MNEATDLHAPRWATSHEDADGGIRWERTETVEIDPLFTTPDAPPETLKVVAMVSDNVVVEDGAVRLVRDDRVQMYVGDGDQMMTLAQARTLAETILRFVDAIEGGQ